MAGYSLASRGALISTYAIDEFATAMRVSKTVEQLKKKPKHSYKLVTS
ncbi:MAG: hypothetical protein LBT37_05900 [Lactobacillaceae bacterium]|jgi:hypothetical protein|nr:hypothetical protein [Lactobacillaceae bacterium]